LHCCIFFLSQKKNQVACMSTLPAVNAIRYPPQDPAMMRLGVKGKKTCDRARGDSSGIPKKPQRKTKRRSLASPCPQKKTDQRNASERVCGCPESLQAHASEEMPIFPWMRGCVTGYHHHRAVCQLGGPRSVSCDWPRFSLGRSWRCRHGRVACSVDRWW
jgi:hypothetical protein